MSQRAMASGRAIDLPPPYRLVSLRESGDAFAHACGVAAELGAGTLVWVRRFDVAEFAVVLEPEEPLSTARRAFYAAMTALADALALEAPPEMPLEFDWPDAIRIDGVLVGGGRLGWPEDCREENTPDWLVFGGMIRTSVMRAGDPGLRPLLGSLDELGFEAIDAAQLIASLARHLMATFHDWQEVGFDAVARRWAERLPKRARRRPEVAANGDLIVTDAAGVQERQSLNDMLATPSWLDPKSGMPWL